MNPARSESPVDPERARLIEAVNQDAATCLGVDLDRDSPAHIVKTVDAVIVRIVFGEADPIPDSEDKEILLGAIWGAQMVRELGWSWVEIRAGEALDLAVVSPGRDMVIHPFSFVGQCLAKRCICTVELSFNMLLERKGEVVFEPNGFENVMAHIRHIIPPYTLEALDPVQD
jgi:hypothetical protein